MTETATRILNKVAWVDLSAKDAAAAREFYGKVFGWTPRSTRIPQYGGYALARVGGKDVAGIGPARWTRTARRRGRVYIGTDDVDALAKKVTGAGGTVIVAPFDVGDQGRMAVFQDPAGAFISAWQGTRMGGFQTNAPNSFGWAELNARGVEKALAVLHHGVRLDGQEEPDGRRPADTTSSRSTATSVAGATGRWTPWCRPRCRATGWSTSTSTTSMRPIARRSSRARGS